MNSKYSDKSIIPSSLVQLSVLFTAFTILFGATFVKLAQDWLTNDNYSHGFLVPLIAGYMIWQKKDRLKNISIRPSNFGLYVIICAMCIFIIGNIGAELFITRIAIIITIVGLCIYLFGVETTRTVAIPLAYLVFMVPLPAIIWNQIAFPLQLFAAKLTAGIVQQAGIPLLREGNILHLSNTTLEVVNACSGLRSLTSLLAISAPFAYLVRISNIGKWLLFLSAVPIAVFVNILRLTSTALLAIYVGPESAQGFLHELSGILVFAAAFASLYVLYLLIRKVEHKITIGYTAHAKKSGLPIEPD